MDVPIVTPPLAVICSGDSTTFTATSLLGTASTYNWYDSLINGNLLFTGDTFNTGAINNAGATDATRMYYVELTDTSGCKSLRTLATVIIRPALDVPIVTPPLAVICSGDSTTFTATSLLGTASTFNWYDSLINGNLLFTGDTFNTGAINNTSTLDATRMYYVELTDTSGCKSLRTLATVIIRPALDLPIVTPPTPICSGDSALLAGNSLLGTAATYNWYDAIINGNLLFTGDTFNTGVLYISRTYFVELVDTSGCRSLRTPILVTVLLNADQPTASAEKSVICVGTLTRIFASSLIDSVYNWYTTEQGGLPIFTGDTFTTPLLTATTTYFIEGVNLLGCKTYRTPISIITIADDTLQAPNVAIASRTTSSATIFWQAIPLATSYRVSTDNGMTWIAPSSGNVGLEHTYNRSSSDKAEISFLVQAQTDATCVDQSMAISKPLLVVFEANELQVFYNAFSPNGDGINDTWLLTDGLENYPDNNVMIFDRWGKEIFNQTGYTATNNNKVFTGSNLDDGTYFYVLKIPSISFEKSGYVMIVR